MFHFPRLAPGLRQVSEVRSDGLPHSDISGSQAAQRLPEAYRSHATSFVAIVCLGILRAPLIPHSSHAIPNKLGPRMHGILDAMITRRL